LAGAYDRDLMTRSLEGALWLQAMIYQHIAREVADELGDEGRERLARGLREYGRWRGRRLATRLSEDATAQQIAEQWDAADLRLPIEQGYPGGGFRPGGESAEISIVESPEWNEWRGGLSDRTLARLYYAEVLSGIAEGYGRGLKIEFPKFGPDLKSLWTVRLTMPGKPVTPGPLRSTALEGEDSARALLMATTENFAGLYYFLAKEIMAGPSLSGEKALRAGTRAYAVDRGRRLRVRHQAEGKPINLQTLTEDYDLPKVSMWDWDASKRIVEPERAFRTCTFCPYAEVWRELGGLDIGYIYDYEFHLNQYQAYLPGVIVEFDGVQTAGSPVCKFRFRMPDPA
jgi:hypothetical protein